MSDKSVPLLNHSSFPSLVWPTADHFQQGAFVRLAVLVAFVMWRWLVYITETKQLDDIWTVLFICFYLPIMWFVCHRCHQHYIGSVIIFLVAHLVSLLLFVWLLQDITIAYMCLGLVIATSLLLGPVAGFGMTTLVILGVTLVVWLEPAIALSIDHYYGLLVQLLLVALLGWQTASGTYRAYESAEHSATEAAHHLLEVRNHRAELQRVLRSLNLSNHLLHRANNELFYARELADTALRFKSEFAAQISHELRTSLNLILGFSETMAFAHHSYGVKLPPPYLRDITEIYRNSQHLLGLIDDILDLSKLEAGRLGLHCQLNHLSKIIHEATDMIRPLATAKRLSVDVQYTATIPLIMFDESRIRQVLLNLLSNAVRVTSVGRITVAVSVFEHEIWVNVCDTGPGINPTDQDFIFEEFRQVDNKGGSAGLGLAVSRRIIHLHGGRMWVESKPGEGSNFIFALPRTNDSISPVIHNAPILATQQTKPVVVAVGETNADEIKLLTRHLDGYSIMPAPTIADALWLIEQNSARAMILNALPADDAILNSIPVPIFICPLPSPTQTARNLGIATFLQKPVSIDAIQNVLKKVAPAARSVLIVDNEPSAVRLIERMLSDGEGSLRIFRAYSGKEAITRATVQVPDVMFLDLMMEDGNGFEVIAHMRSQPETAAIPIIAVSGCAVEELWQGNVIEIKSARGFAPTQMLNYLGAALDVTPPAKFSHHTMPRSSPANHLDVQA